MVVQTLYGLTSSPKHSTVHTLTLSLPMTSINAMHDSSFSHAYVVLERHLKMYKDEVSKTIL